MLRSARDPMPLPASFRAEVWRRIESRPESNRSWTHWLDTWIGHLLRPAVATASVVATILLGASLGFTGKPDSVEVENRYLRSVSPFHQAQR